MSLTFKSRSVCALNLLSEMIRRALFCTYVIYITIKENIVCIIILEQVCVTIQSHYCLTLLLILKILVVLCTELLKTINANSSKT